jgi:gluconokinase
MIVVLMGVSGSGKTAVGEALAARLGWHFEDADTFHSAANVEKMRRGIALTDDDREPWIRAVSRAIHDWSGTGRNVVLACSALRKRHREILRAGADDGLVRLVYLRGSYDEIDRRLRRRAGHFMPESLLRSQFDALEAPDATEALIVDVDPPIPEIVDSIVRGLHVGGS